MATGSVTSSSRDVIRSRPTVLSLNDHVTCGICSGYFIDATTIGSCLHSFCRTCIVLHLQRSKFCPTCQRLSPNDYLPQVKALRTDRILQTIVYKIVPGLFNNEARRRYEFKHNGRVDKGEGEGDERGGGGGKMKNVGTEEKEDEEKPEEEEEVLAVRNAEAVVVVDDEDDDLPTISPMLSPFPILSPFPSRRHRRQVACRVYGGSESVGICLQSCDKYPVKQNHCSVDGHGAEGKKDEEIGCSRDRRYLLCPVFLTIGHLKKFLQLKFDLEDDKEIDLFHSEENLPSDYTLADVIYIYSRQKIFELTLQYVIWGKESDVMASFEVGQFSTDVTPNPSSIYSHVSTVCTTSAIYSVAPSSSLLTSLTGSRRSKRRRAELEMSESTRSKGNLEEQGRMLRGGQSSIRTEKVGGLRMVDGVNENSNEGTCRDDGDNDQMRHLKVNNTWIQALPQTPGLQNLTEIHGLMSLSSTTSSSSSDILTSVGGFPDSDEIRLGFWRSKNPQADTSPAPELSTEIFIADSFPMATQNFIQTEEDRTEIMNLIESQTNDLDAAFSDVISSCRSIQTQQLIGGLTVGCPDSLRMSCRSGFGSSPADWFSAGRDETATGNSSEFATTSSVDIPSRENSVQGNSTEAFVIAKLPHLTDADIDREIRSLAAGLTLKCWPGNDLGIPLERMEIPDSLESMACSYHSEETPYDDHLSLSLEAFRNGDRTSNNLEGVEEEVDFREESMTGIPGDIYDPPSMIFPNHSALVESAMSCFPDDSLDKTSSGHERTAADDVMSHVFPQSCKVFQSQYVDTRSILNTNHPTVGTNNSEVGGCHNSEQEVKSDKCICVNATDKFGEMKNGGVDDFAVSKKLRIASIRDDLSDSVSNHFRLKYTEIELLRDIDGVNCDDDDDDDDAVNGSCCERDDKSGNGSAIAVTSSVDSLAPNSGDSMTVLLGDRTDSISTSSSSVHDSPALAPAVTVTLSSVPSSSSSSSLSCISVPVSSSPATTLFSRASVGTQTNPDMLGRYFKRLSKPVGVFASTKTPAKRGRQRSRQQPPPASTVPDARDYSSSPSLSVFSVTCAAAAAPASTSETPPRLKSYLKERQHYRHLPPYFRANSQSCTPLGNPSGICPPIGINGGRDGALLITLPAGAVLPAAAAASTSVPSVRPALTIIGPNLSLNGCSVPSAAALTPILIQTLNHPQGMPLHLLIPTVSIGRPTIVSSSAVVSGSAKKETEAAAAVSSSTAEDELPPANNSAVGVTSDPVDSSPDRSNPKSSVPAPIETNKLSSTLPCVPNKHPVTSSSQNKERRIDEVGNPLCRPAGDLPTPHGLFIRRGSPGSKPLSAVQEYRRPQVFATPRVSIVGLEQRSANRQQPCLTDRKSTVLFKSPGCTASLSCGSGVQVASRGFTRAPVMSRLVKTTNCANVTSRGLQTAGTTSEGTCSVGGKRMSTRHHTLYSANSTKVICGSEERNVSAKQNNRGKTESDAKRPSPLGKIIHLAPASLIHAILEQKLQEPDPDLEPDGENSESIEAVSSTVPCLLPAVSARNLEQGTSTVSASTQANHLVGDAPGDKPPKEDPRDVPAPPSSGKCERNASGSKPGTVAATLKHCDANGSRRSGTSDVILRTKLTSPIEQILTRCPRSNSSNISNEQSTSITFSVFSEVLQTGFLKKSDKTRKSKTVDKPVKIKPTESRQRGLTLSPNDGLCKVKQSSLSSSSFLSSSSSSSSPLNDGGPAGDSPVWVSSSYSATDGSRNLDEANGGDKVVMSSIVCRKDAKSSEPCYRDFNSQTITPTAGSAITSPGTEEPLQQQQQQQQAVVDEWELEKRKFWRPSRGQKTKCGAIALPKKVYTYLGSAKSHEHLSARRRDIDGRGAFESPLPHPSSTALDQQQTPGLQNSSPASTVSVVYSTPPSTPLYLTTPLASGDGSAPPIKQLRLMCSGIPYTCEANSATADRSTDQPQKRKSARKRAESSSSSQRKPRSKKCSEIPAGGRKGDRVTA